MNLLQRIFSPSLKMNIQYNKKYLSSVLADTDLHGGGIFFCILYQDCLEFNKNGEVILTKRLIDATRPMDNSDIERIQKYEIKGNFHSNKRGYIVCEFQELLVEYTGLPTIKDPSIIPFHIYDSRFSKNSSVVFKLEV